MSNPSRASVVAFRASNGGNGVLVPRKSFETRFAGGEKTAHPLPPPATNRMPAPTATMTTDTPFAPRIAPAGGAAPPAAMPGANACHYLNVTGNAKVGTSRELGPMRGRSSCRAFEAFLEDVEARVEHVPRNVERGDVSHSRIATGEQDQAVLVRVLLDRVAAFRVRLLGSLVRHELGGLHHPEPTPVSDELVSLRHLVESFREVRSDLRTSGHQVFVLDHVERGQRRGARDRVSAERVRVLPTLLEVHLRGVYRRTDREIAPERLGHRQDVRHRLRVFDRPHLPGPAESRLDFVVDQQEAMVLGDLRYPIHPSRRRDDISSFALYRLDEDARGVIRRGDRFHVDVLDDVRTVQIPRRIGELVRAAVTVRIRNVHDAGHRRKEPGTLLRLARRQRESTLGAPVERAEEREEHLPLRVTLGDFDRGLVRLRPRVAEEDLLRMLAGGDLPQSLGERRLDFVVEVGPREMGKLRRLAGDRLDDLRVRVTDVEDRNPGREVDQEVAVDVFDDGARGPLDDDGGRLGGSCNVAVVPRDDLLRLRAGGSHFDVGDLHRCTLVWPTVWAY